MRPSVVAVGPSPVTARLPQRPGRAGGAPRHARRHAAVAALATHRCAVRTAAVSALAAGLVAVLVAFARPLPAWCAAVAIAVRLAGGTQYALAVVRGRACPNIVTWFLWGLTPMIVVAARIGDHPGPEVAVTFVLGLGPLVVATLGFCTDRSASQLTPFTLGCAIASLAGIVAWRLTAMPLVAILFCIVADLLATLPTLRKAYAAPESEYAPPYLLSVLAMLVTLGTVDGGGFTAYGFPLYMLLVNVTLFAFAALPLASMRDTPAPWRPRAGLLHPARRPRHGIPRGYRPDGRAVTR